MSNSRNFQAPEIRGSRVPLKPEPWLGDVLLLVMASVIAVLLTLLVPLILAGD